VSKVVKFLDPEQGLQDVLLISGEVSPLVTPERIKEMQRRGLLARAPITVKDLGTLLIPSKGQSPASLRHYLIDIGELGGYQT
jgi:hypothetical protein